jgi:predicted RNA-binding protein with PUA-like domain
VRLAYRGRFKELFSLDRLKELFDAEQLPVVRKGNRLSIMPVPVESAGRLLGLLGPMQP